MPTTQKIQDYLNNSKPGQSIGNYQNSIAPPAPAPTTPMQTATNQPAPNQPSPVTPTIARDSAKEMETLKKMGISNIQAMQLGDNPAFQENFLKMTYGQDADKIAEYQKLMAAKNEREGIGNQMSQIRQNAPNAMLALEDALRTKTDVGNQKMGTSELYEKAGLKGMPVLSQSLQEQGRLMSQRYGSFVNALSRVGQYQANQYKGLSDTYKTLNDEYNTQVEQMNKTLDQIQEYNQGLEIAERQMQMQKDLALWERDLERGTFDPTIMDQNMEAYQNGDLKSTQTSIIKGMTVVDANNANGDNCVLYLRSTGSEMPYGLYTIQDKVNAVAKAGSRDMSKIKVGDVIATSEGDWGHVARVKAINGEKLILEEANYKPGKVTVGRTIDRNDRSILGYFDNKPSGWQGPMMQTGDNVDKEGFNPSIEEYVLGGGQSGGAGLTQAIDLGMKSVISKLSVAAQGDAKETMDQLLSSGQTDQAKEYLKTLIRSSASSSQQDVLDGKQDTLSALDRIEQSLADYKAMGGNTGLLVNVSEKSLNKLGKTLGGNFAKILNDINLAMVDYRKAVSGAAFTESEAKTYEALFPSTGNIPELNDAKIASLREKLITNQENFYKQRIGENNYNTIFGGSSMDQSMMPSNQSTLDDSDYNFFNNLN